MNFRGDSWLGHPAHTTVVNCKLSRVCFVALVGKNKGINGFLRGKNANMSVEFAFCLKMLWKLSLITGFSCSEKVCWGLAFFLGAAGLLP